MRTASAAARARRASGGAAPLSDLGAAGATDERVAALLAWLRRERCADHAWRVERVLDVGCNAAKPLIELCQALEPPPTRAVGVDIDPALVQQARHALRLAWCEREPADGVATPQPHYFPASFPALFGTLPYPPVERGVFPHNLAFYEADWVNADRHHATSAPRERRPAPEEPHSETLADEEREGFDLILWYVPIAAAQADQQSLADQVGALKPRRRWPLAPVCPHRLVPAAGRRGRDRAAALALLRAGPLDLTRAARGACAAAHPARRLCMALGVSLRTGTMRPGGHGPRLRCVKGVQHVHTDKKGFERPVLLYRLPAMTNTGATACTAHTLEGQLHLDWVPRASKKSRVASGPAQGKIK